MKKQTGNLFRNLSYKESKGRIENWLIEMRIIENRLMGKLIFEKNYLCMDGILRRVKDSEKNHKNRYNHGNKSVLITIFDIDKNEMLVILQLFVSTFNEFDYDSRVIIYNSFFQNRLNEAIAQKLNLSSNKLGRLKNRAVIELAEALGLELLAYYFGLT